MPLLALTGGIASGKSTVAARLAGHGAVIVDADALAREVVEPGSEALAAIRRAFGPAVFGLEGALDRAALGRIVFADADARRRLNAIVHPPVIALSQQRFREAVETDPKAVVLYDVPLIDARSATEFERIVLTDAPAATRIRRLVELRGMTEADAAARVAAQLSDEERRRLATDVLDTSGSLEQTLAAADALWERIRP